MYSIDLDQTKVQRLQRAWMPGRKRSPPCVNPAPHVSLAGGPSSWWFAAAFGIVVTAW